MEREPIVFSGNVLTNGSAGKNKTQMYHVAFKCLAYANISALKACASQEVCRFHTL